MIQAANQRSRLRRGRSNRFAVVSWPKSAPDASAFSSFAVARRRRRTRTRRIVEELRFLLDFFLLRRVFDHFPRINQKWPVLVLGRGPQLLLQSVLLNTKFLFGALRRSLFFGQRIDKFIRNRRQTLTL